MLVIKTALADGNDDSLDPSISYSVSDRRRRHNMCEGALLHLLGFKLTMKRKIRT